MDKCLGTFYKSLKTSYHNLDIIILISLMQFIIIFSELFIFPYLLGLISLFTLILPFIYVGLEYTQQKLLDKKTKFFRIFVPSFKKYFFQAVGLNIVYGLLIALTVISWMAYGDKGSYLYFFIAVFQTYFLFMVSCALLYMPSLAVKYEYGFKKSLVESIKLFTKFPFYTIKVVFTVLLITVVLSLTVIGFVVLYFGFIVLFTNLASSNVISATLQELDNK